MSFAYSYARALRESLTSHSDNSLATPAPNSDSLGKGTQNEGQEQSFLALVGRLNTLNKAFQESKVNLFFLSPAIPIEAKKQVLKKLFESLGDKGLICSFLYLLLDKKKWAKLPAIIRHLNKIKTESQGFVPAEVESAFPLSTALKNQLAHKLSLFLGKKQVQIKEKLNPDIIGGVKIRAEGFVFDDSLSSHLKRMENLIIGEHYGRTSK